MARHRARALVAALLLLLSSLPAAARGEEPAVARRRFTVPGYRCPMRALMTVVTAA